MSAADFPPAFLVWRLTAASCLIFLRLPPDAGAELSGRGAAGAAEARQELGPVVIVHSARIRRV